MISSAAPVISTPETDAERDRSGPIEQLRVFFGHRPLARFCTAYLMGTAAYVLPGGGEAWFTPQAIKRAVLTAVLVALLGGAASLHPSPHRRCASRAPVALYILAAAGFLHAAAVLAVSPSDVSHLACAHLITIDGVTISAPRLGAAGVSFNIDCESAWVGDRYHGISGRAEVWIPRPYGSVGPWKPHIRLPVAGQRLAVTGVLGIIAPGSRPDAASLRRQHIFSSVRVGKGGTIQLGGAAGRSIASGCSAVSQWLLEGADRNVGPEERQALGGMLFHERAGISQGVMDDLQRSGTVHIIATAGLHVGIFLALAMGALCVLLPRRGAVILTMLLLAGYCVACGAWPAVVRATLIAELALLAWLIGRLPDTFTCLCLAAAVLVAGNPNEILDAGFQLTFFTVGVILLALPLLHEAQDYTPHRGSMFKAADHGREIACLSLAAQVGSWPLTACYFGVISFVGVIANLLVVPLLMLIIPYSLICGAIGHLIPPLSSITGPWLDLLLRLLLATSHLMASIPGAWCSVGPIPWPAAAAYYVVLFGGLIYVRGSIRKPGQSLVPDHEDTKEEKKH